MTAQMTAPDLDENIDIDELDSALADCDVEGYVKYEEPFDFDAPDSGHCHCYCHKEDRSHTPECCRRCGYCSRFVRMECFFEHRFLCEKAHLKRNPPPKPDRSLNSEKPSMRSSGSRGETKSYTKQSKGAKHRR